MPLTGNQANSARPFEDDMELADDPWVINQIIGAINGDYGLRIRLIGYNNSSTYAVEIRNADPANGKGLLVTDSSGATILDVRKAATSVVPEFNVYNASLQLIATINNTGIVMSSGKKITFPQEVGVKEDYTNVGQVLVGVDASTLYWRADGNYSWRDQSGVERMKLTTGGTPVLTVGGATVPTGSQVATVTYTGNGGSSTRQIACGFVPSFAILTGGTVDADLQQYLIHNTSSAVKHYNGGNETFTSSVKLRGDDGITVADGSTEGNVNTKAYTLKAWR